MLGSMEPRAGAHPQRQARILRLPSRVPPTPHETIAIQLDDVERAHERIMRYLRYTPLMKTWLTRDDGARMKISLKLENLQITEGFAVRGMLNAALTLPPRQLARGLVGYGLMHGSAAAYVGHVLDVPALVYLYPRVATPDLVRSLQYWGAQIEVINGTTLADTERVAQEGAERDGLNCIQGSESLSFIAGARPWPRMLEFAPELDVLVMAAGLDR